MSISSWWAQKKRETEFEAFIAKFERLEAAGQLPEEVKRTAAEFKAHLREAVRAGVDLQVALDAFIRIVEEREAQHEIDKVCDDLQAALIRDKDKIIAARAGDLKAKAELEAAMAAELDQSDAEMLAAYKDRLAKMRPMSPEQMVAEQRVLERYKAEIVDKIDTPELKARAEADLERLKAALVDAIVTPDFKAKAKAALEEKQRDLEAEVRDGVTFIDPALEWDEEAEERERLRQKAILDADPELRAEFDRLTSREEEAE